MFFFSTENKGEGLKVEDPRIESRTTSSLTVVWGVPEDSDQDVIAYRVALKAAKEEDNPGEGDNADDTGTDEMAVDKEGGDDVAMETEEDASCLLQEIKVDGSVTRATFSELDSGKTYLIEIYTVCEIRESDATTIKGKTSEYVICIPL